MGFDFWAREEYSLQASELDSLEVQTKTTKNHHRIDLLDFGRTPRPDLNTRERERRCRADGSVPIDLFPVVSEAFVEGNEDGSLFRHGPQLLAPTDLPSSKTRQQQIRA
jgi:hypothetical protein